MENINDTISCKFCWEKIKASAIKCKHCWEFLNKENNSVPYQQPTINIVNQQNNNSLDSSTQKSWVVALILSIFFWLFWFDRFYLWHGWLWFIKLISFWWFWILYVIDIFLILTKNIAWIKWK